MNSKIHILLYTIISALIIAGLVWKFSSSDQPIKAEPIQNRTIVQQKEKEIKKATKAEQKPVEKPVKKPEPRFKNIEEYNVAKQKALRKMQLSMRYADDPEAVLRDIVYYQEVDDQKNVDLLIEYLIETFPDFEMPDNLLKE